MFWSVLNRLQGCDKSKVQAFRILLCVWAGFVSKSVQVLLNGTEAVLVLTWIIRNGIIYIYTYYKE